MANRLASHVPSRSSHELISCEDRGPPKRGGFKSEQSQKEPQPSFSWGPEKLSDLLKATQQSKARNRSCPFFPKENSLGRVL